MQKLKSKKFIILFVFIIIVLIFGLFFYSKNKSIFKDKHMMEVTFTGYKPNEITPLMCSEITDNIELGDLNVFKTLEDIKMFNNLESISIGNIDSEPEEIVISDKKLDEFIKQLNEAFVILPNLQC